MDRLRSRQLVRWAAVAIGLLALASCPAAHAVGFVNGGFETGDFTGWSTTGTAAVTEADAYTEPPEGSFMACLGTADDPGSSIWDNSISQTVEGPSNISFRYNFFSYDVLPADDPGFAVHVNGVEVLTVSAPPVNEWVFSTGWQQFIYQLPGPGPYTVELVFNAGNTLSEWIQSWVYIDDVGPLQQTAELLMSDATTVYGRPMTLTAQLTAAGPGLPNQTVEFYVDNDDDGERDEPDELVGSDITDQDGMASIPYTCWLAPKVYTMWAVFPGNYEFPQAETSALLGVSQETTAISIGPALGSMGQLADLVARLTGPAGSPIPGKEIFFYVNANGGNVDVSDLVGSAITDGDGYATFGYLCSIAPGAYDTKAEFPGDAYYQGMSRLSTLEVIVTVPTEVWVDATYQQGSCGGHIWQYDAFDTIQDGVNAVEVGGTVHVGPGTYQEGLQIGKRLTLEGTGSGQDPASNTVIVGSSPAMTVTVGGTSPTERSVIRGVAVTGGTGYAEAGAGIVMQDGVGYITFDNVQAFGNEGHGICWAASGPLYDCLLTSCLLVGNGMYGLSVPDTASLEGLLVEGCCFDDNREIGLAVHGTGHTAIVVSSSTFRRNGRGFTSGGYGDLALWEFVGDATVYDVSVYSQDTDTAVRIAGGGPAGAVALVNLSIQRDAGAAMAASTGLLLGGYSSVASISLSGVSIGEMVKGLELNGVGGSGTPGTYGPGDLDIGETSLDAGNAEFIRLQNSTCNVDATGAAFGGGGGGGAIEDKVWHIYDDPALGRVLYPDARKSTAVTVYASAAARGQTTQLNAQLRWSSVGLPGKPVAFWLDGSLLGSVVTDSLGNARLPYTIPLGAALGGHPIIVVFGGDAAYQPSLGRNTLAVSTALPTSITLTPDPAGPIVAGSSIAFRVTDSDGVDRTASSSYTSPSAAGGSWTANSYRSAKAGSWKISAKWGRLSDTAALTVTHGPAVRVDIAPLSALIANTQTQVYTVQATDSFGNSWGPAAGDIIWAENGAGAFVGTTYTPALGEVDTVTITATVDGVPSPPASLQVVPASGPGPNLAWDKDTRRFYLTATPQNPAGAPIPAVEVSASGTYVIDGQNVVVQYRPASPTYVDVRVTNVATGMSNSLKVRWYLRGGALIRVYQYSTIGGVTSTATYDGVRTTFANGYRRGYWGLCHTISRPSGAPPAVEWQSVALGQALQP